MSRDWSVDKYKNPLEPYEQWELKKKFMETFRDSFPEERVVSMAQVLVNIEFLGCRYPTETMKAVAELSKGIVEEFRERQKTRLQRTFVGAAEAAGAKVKGKKAAVSEPIPKRGKKDEESETPAVEPVEDLEQDDNMGEDIPADGSEQKKSKRKKKKKLKVEDEPELEEVDKDGAQPADTDSVQTKNLTKSQRNSLSQLVLVLYEGKQDTEPALQIISRAAQMSKVPMEYLFECEPPDVTCTLKINHVSVARVKSEDRKSARRLAADEALQSLQRSQFSITEKNYKDSAVSSDVMLLAYEKNAENKAEQSGIGSRLMKLMGWSGGGLGAAQQGRLEPVEQTSVIGKAGLGYQDANRPSGKVFEEMVHKKLSDYVADSKNHCLVFPSEYSVDERKIIHRVANRFGLKSTSRGSGTNRQLYISRKLPSHLSLLNFARLLADQQRSGSIDPIYSNYTVTEPSV